MILARSSSTVLPNVSVNACFSAPEIDETRVQRALHIAMYNSLRSNIDISPGQLAALADRRAKAVKRYLINDAAIDANRLFQLNSRHHLQEDVSGATLTLEAD